MKALPGAVGVTSPGRSASFRVPGDLFGYASMHPRPRSEGVRGQSETLSKVTNVTTPRSEHATMKDSLDLEKIFGFLRRGASFALVGQCIFCVFCWDLERVPCTRWVRSFSSSKREAWGWRLSART